MGDKSKGAKRSLEYRDKVAAKYGGLFAKRRDGDGQRWRDVDNGLVVNFLDRVVASGDAVMFYASQDQGALGCMIMAGEEKIKMPMERDPEAIDAWLQAVVASLIASEERGS